MRTLQCETYNNKPLRADVFHICTSLNFLAGQNPSWVAIYVTPTSHCKHQIVMSISPKEVPIPKTNPLCGITH
jgi:hypothetical protein